MSADRVRLAGISAAPLDLAAHLALVDDARMGAETSFVGRVATTIRMPRARSSRSSTPRIPTLRRPCAPWQRRPSGRPTRSSR